MPGSVGRRGSGWFLRHDQLCIIEGGEVSGASESFSLMQSRGRHVKKINIYVYTHVCLSVSLAATLEALVSPLPSARHSQVCVDEAFAASPFLL